MKPITSNRFLSVLQICASEYLRCNYQRSPNLNKQGLYKYNRNKQSENDYVHPQSIEAFKITHQLLERYQNQNKYNPRNNIDHELFKNQVQVQQKIKKLVSLSPVSYTHLTLPTIYSV